jgi:hypothetical protein
MLETLSSSSSHGAMHRARRYELEASALSSRASLLHPDMDAFLRLARAASSMAADAEAGTATEAGTASTGGGLRAGLDRLDEWPRW